MSPNSPTPLTKQVEVLPKRLLEISKCMDYIHECNAGQSKDKSFEENWNWIWGWLDWMEELHRLLHYYES